MTHQSDISNEARPSRPTAHRRTDVRGGQAVCKGHPSRIDAAARDARPARDVTAFDARPARDATAFDARPARDRVSRDAQDTRAQAPRRTMRGRLQRVIGLLGAHQRALVVVLAIAAALGMVYVPLRDYYDARRTGEDLQARYDALNAANDELAAERDRLMTPEGIQDEARERGYVSEGETSVVVSGLPVGEQADPSARKAYEDKRPALTKVLDLLFAYDPEATWNE